MQIAFVGGIILRQTEQGREFLVQTRWKPAFDPEYSGTIEFPAGILDVPYENVFDALAREIKEETGLTLKSVINQDKTEVISSNGKDGSFGFRPFCCVQQLKSGKSWIGFIFLCEVKDGTPQAQESEVKDVRWMSEKDLKNLFMTNKSAFFGLELPAWDYYWRSEGALRSEQN